MNRGDIWLADLPPPLGRRPALLLSRDAAYDRRLSVTIATVTTRIRRLPGEVMLSAGEGLREPSVVSLDNIQTVEKQRLLRYIGALSTDRMRAVEDAIHFALGLSY